jgi:hypothetical protein
MSTVSAPYTPEQIGEIDAIMGLLSCGSGRALYTTDENKNDTTTINYRSELRRIASFFCDSREKADEAIRVAIANVMYGDNPTPYSELASEQHEIGDIYKLVAEKLKAIGAKKHGDWTSFIADKTIGPRTLS